MHEWTNRRLIAPAQPSFQFYHSLRAVKVLLAALRSTLTVLALRMEGPYRSRWKNSCSFLIKIAFGHLAQRILGSHDKLPILRGV
jgi:hypothetical protein